MHKIVFAQTFVLTECVLCAGYTDQGAYLRSEYQDDGRITDPTYDFEQDIERLWRQVRPLYEQLHAYTRRRLQARYVNETFPVSGHIPAHLLGQLYDMFTVLGCISSSMFISMCFFCR